MLTLYFQRRPRRQQQYIPTQAANTKYNTGCLPSGALCTTTGTVFLAEHYCDSCCTTQPRATVHKTPCMACIHQLHTTMTPGAIVHSRGQGKNALEDLSLRSRIPASAEELHINVILSPSLPLPPPSSTSTGCAWAPPFGEARPFAGTTVR